MVVNVNRSKLTLKQQHHRRYTEAQYNTAAQYSRIKLKYIFKSFVLGYIPEKKMSSVGRLAAKFVQALSDFVPVGVLERELLSPSNSYHSEWSDHRRQLLQYLRLGVE